MSRVRALPFFSVARNAPPNMSSSGPKASFGWPRSPSTS